MIKTSRVVLTALMLLLVALPGALNAGLQEPLAAGWIIDTIDDSGNVSERETSLVVDSAGYPHIAYFDHTNFEVTYAHYVGSGGNCGPGGNTWQCDPIANQGYVGGVHISLALDSSDNPHVAYWPVDISGDNLGYAHYVGSGGNCGPGSSWQCDTVDSPGDVGRYCSLEIDSFGDPHISYWNATSGSLKYTYYVGMGGNCGPGGNTWQCDTIDTTSNPYGYTSLALDSSDIPHISYYDGFNGDLRYTHYVGAGGNCGPGGNTWECETVDNGGIEGDDVGQYTSLDITPLLGMSISYYDVTNGALKWASYADPVWQIETVESTDNVGQFSSLGQWAIASYYDVTNGDLKLAWRVGLSQGNCGPDNNWQCDIVDDGGVGGDDVGRSTSLDVTETDKGWVAISYVDVSNGYLKCAWWCTEPGISFDYSPEPVCRSNVVNFDASGWGSPPLSYSWDFGDTGTSALEDPAHVYTSEGTYSVTAEVANRCGSESIVERVIVYGFPNADFEHSVPACAGQTTRFTDTTVASGTLSYQWDFGDNSAVSTAASPSYTYTSQGVYSVRMTATNECADDVAVQSVLVQAVPSGVTFDWLPTEPRVGREATFRAQASGIPPFLFLWDFGDGEGGAGQEVKHAYGSEGGYCVVVTATNGCGLDSTSRTVVVGPPLWTAYLPVVMKGLDTADVYEPDNTPAEARHLFLGMLQRHLINPAGDVDWARVYLEAGHTYRFETGGLGPDTDTILTLYESDGQTQVDQNDDCHPEAGDIWSCLDFSPITTGWYFLRVHDYQEGEGGQGHTYTLQGYE